MTMENNELVEGCENLTNALNQIETSVEQLCATPAEYDSLLRPVVDAIAMASRLAGRATVNFKEQAKQNNNNQGGKMSETWIDLQSGTYGCASDLVTVENNDEVDFEGWSDSMIIEYGKTNGTHLPNAD